MMIHCIAASSSNNLDHYCQYVTGLTPHLTPPPSLHCICLSFKEKMIILTAAISRVTEGIVQSKHIAIQLSSMLDVSSLLTASQTT